MFSEIHPLPALPPFTLSMFLGGFFKFWYPDYTVCILDKQPNADISALIYS